MTAALRLAVSLVASLLLWLPTIPNALAVHEDPARIALRYLLALVVSLVGVGIVFRIVNGYAAAIEDDDVEEDGFDSVEEEVLFGRRHDDETGAEDEATEEELLDDALDDVRDTNALVS